MSVQLQELLDRIKNDGLKQAREEAAQIKAGAQKEANEIISRAKREASALKDKAEKEARQFEVSADAALYQAARDILLGLKAEIGKLFDAVLKREVGRALSQDTLKQAVLTVLNGLAGKQGFNVDVLLPEKEARAVSDYVLSQLKQDLQKGIEFKPSPGLKSGFKISEKDGSAFYDFTEEGLAAILSEQVNERVAQVLKGT